MSRTQFRKKSLTTAEISQIIKEEGGILKVLDHNSAVNVENSVSYKFSQDTQRIKTNARKSKLEDVCDLVNAYFPLNKRYNYSQDLHQEFIMDFFATINRQTLLEKNTSKNTWSRLSAQTSRVQEGSVQKKEDPKTLVEAPQITVKEVKGEFAHRKIKEIFKKIEPKECTDSTMENENLPHGINKLSKKVVKEYERILTILYTQNNSADAKSLLNNTLRHVGAFQKMTDSVFQRLCSCIKLEIIPAKTCIFKKGDPGNCWYIILLGYVRIRVQPDSSNHELTVATLGPGEGFGEQAIVTDSTRAASAYAASNPTILARIDKSDYRRVMNFLRNLEKKEKVFFLKYVKLLSKFDQISLRNLADRITMRKFEAGNYLIKESEVCNSVYFIKSGSASVYRTLVISPTKTKEVFLGKVSRGDSVNEDVLLDRPNYSGSLVTVIADEPIEFGAVLAYGDLERFPFTYTRPAYLDYTISDLTKLNWIQENMTKFWRLQKRLLRDVKVKAGQGLSVSYKD
jgi:CRP-like cAMP-binding protein